MKKQLLAIAAVATLSLSNAQDPQITSWMLNTTGTATYNVGAGTVQMQDSADVTKVCYNTNFVYVVAEGLANYEMGPFPSNPNTPSGQGFTWKFTRTPQPETGTHYDQPSTGALGAAVNGVSLYGISDARSYDPQTGQNSGSGAGIWNSDAWVSEGSTMDANGNGHPQQQGQYHYHANPITLYSDPSTSHSPIIGWAFDGYPIYGPFGYSSPMDNQSAITRMETSYQLRTMSDRSTLPDGSPSSPPGPPINATYPMGTYTEDYEYVNGLGHLDEFGGRTCVTPEYPGGTYAYFMSTESNGDPKFPYIMGLQYYGVVTQNDVLGGTSATIPPGVTCITPTSNDLKENSVSNFLIYPNPTDDQITLELTPNVNWNVIIVDATGRQVLSKSLSTVQLSLGHLENGFYQISVHDADGIIKYNSAVVVQ